QTPLGVDLALFNPAAFSASLRAEVASDSQVLLVHCGRLSAEKRPDRSLDAPAALRAAGVDAVPVVGRDRPLRAPLRQRAAGRPGTGGTVQLAGRGGRVPGGARPAVAGAVPGGRRRGRCGRGRRWWAGASFWRARVCFRWAGVCSWRAGVAFGGAGMTLFVAL